MGFDLVPRRREAGDFHFGAFSWSWMLNAGVGLVIGLQDNGAGQYIYVGREVGRRRVVTSPMHNDGFPVTASEARAMALAARGLVAAERHRREVWDAMPEEERKRIEAMPLLRRPRSVPVREDFIARVESFADWATRSGGFRIL